MVDYLKIIDFTKETKEEPRFKDHLPKVAKDLATQYKNDDNYKQPVNDTDLSNITILTGLPKITEDKLEKLTGFFKAAVLAKNDIPEPQIVFDVSNGQMNGTALLTFSDQDTAKSAAAKLNGYQFDKTHTLSACTNEDFDQFVALEDKYAAPKFQTKEDLQTWLLDHRFREQIMLRVQNRHYLQWFDHVSKVDPILSGNTFNEFGEINKFEWSRGGSYLVTFHDAGFALWGGKTFEKLNFYPHPEVIQVDFSPDETYVLSFNGTVNDAPNSENYIVWRVNTVGKLRAFKASQTETWGCYKWNFDGKYLANFGNDLLNIYELPSMSRIADPQTQKKSPIRVPSIQNISWAPNKNLLCIASYKPSAGTKGDAIGKIYIIDIPSRTILKWKTITWEFNNCDIYWENTGVKITLVLRKLLKNKKFSTVIQLGEIKHNNIVVEEQEFNDVKFVNIDDTGKKIAVTYVDPGQKDNTGVLAGYNVDIYKTDSEVRGKYLQKIGSLTDKPISHVMWSPNGVFFALVNIDKFSAKIGTLEFGLIKGANLEIVKATKFSYMISASWDPSGRYLVTSSTKGQYTIWTAFGDAIIKDNFNEINQIQWRPKPKIVLPEELETQITTNLKKFTKKFEDDDDRILNEDKYKKEKIRKEQKEEFEKLLSKKKKTWEDTKAERVNLLGFDEDNMTDLVYDEIVEGEEAVDLKK